MASLFRCPKMDWNTSRFLVEACRRAGIRAEVLDPEEAKRLEPAANPALIGAVRVPDGAVDPFRLTSSNILDAMVHGAEIRTYTEVKELIREQDRMRRCEGL